jgi:hypothetical protein
MTDRTLIAVERQTAAMGVSVYEVGLFKPAMDHQNDHAEMLPRSWDIETLIKSVLWLKFQNRDGRNIYIRPKGEHALTMVDDLTAAALEGMEHSGFTPAVIVETSPGNFQAWLNHGKVLPREVSSAAARDLAQKFDGDRGSADWRHYGRLAGFTNRKEKHRQQDGQFPFVRLIHSGGDVYPAAADFIGEVEAKLESARENAERLRQRAGNGAWRRHATVKTIDDFRRDPRYSGDGNRVDLAYAVYALSHGASDEQVRNAIASRDLSHKGNEKRQADYIERTIHKALLAYRDRGLGR